MISPERKDAQELFRSKDGSTLFLVGNPNVVTAVESSTGSVKMVYKTENPVYQNFLSSIPFNVSANGDRILIGTCASVVDFACQAGYAEVFDVSSGQEIGAVSVGLDEVTSVALSPDGSTGYIAHYTDVVVCCELSRTRADSVPPNSFTTFSVVGSVVGPSLQTNVAPGKIVLNSTGTIAYCGGIPDGGESNILAISLPGLTVLNQASAGSRVVNIAISGNDATIVTTESFYFTAGQNDFVHFYNASLTPTGIVTLAADAATFTHASLDPAGEFAYVGNGPFQINSQTLSVTQTYTTGVVLDVVLGVEGQAFFTLLSAGANLAVFEAPSGKPAKLLPITTYPGPLIPDPVAPVLFSAASGVAAIATTGKVLTNYLGSDGIISLAVNSNGSTLYASDYIGNRSPAWPITGHLELSWPSLTCRRPRRRAPSMFLPALLSFLR